ncbi:MAG: chitobiase/beta-hexosaminidase C-terminal domain-containing protein, partial [Clostridia bacterium]|nr:chitobiase/beta-hexosaminidase C-terminal domain-containing protein [Clostridia bacterium]
RVNYTIPDTAASGDRFTITASSDTASASAAIVYMPSDTQIKEFYFVHAGAQTYLVKDGKNSTTKYYTYVSAGNESDKYWTFSATITSPTEIAEDSPVTVLIGMMDGSSMTFDLTRVSASGSAGAYEYTYAGEIYIDQLGYHEFKSSLIPCEFDLLFEDQIQSADTDAQFANAWNDAMDRMDLIQSAFSDTDVFNPQVMGELLSGFYKVSDKDWFAELPDDTKTAVLEAETQLEGAAKEFCLALKIPYDSVDEYLIPSEDPDTAPSLNVDKVLENNGISMSAYDGFDADALAADGYTIYTVPSQRRGPQQHVAIKETDEGIYTISEEEGFKLEVDYTQNAADNAATAAFIDSLSTVGDAAETAADALAVAGKAGSLPVLGKMAGGAANVATVLDLRNNVNDMGGIYSDIENLKGYITNRQMWYNRYLNLHVSDKCLASMRAEIRAANELLDYLQRHARSLERDICLGITMFAVGVVVGGPAVAVLSITIDYTTNSASMSRASMLEIYMHNLSIATARVMRDCEGEEEEALRRWKLRAVLDPSGVVYEAIESNVLEGVTATMWYADNAAGTGAVQWDASEYDQVNPQVTAADGRFAWDVPTGFWQVRFTKAGYEDAATEWLEVPPPRMNLLVPMVTTKEPNVESANAYEDYIEVIFDQYMDKSAALTLPDGMTGEWQGTDAYSKVLRITKDGGFTKGDEVALTIDGAKNYAGTPLSPSPYSKNLTVGARPAEIILNYDSVVAMKAGETPNVNVRIKDSDGNYMSGVTLSAAVGNTSLATIDATATTDDSGKAVFASSALLPGLTDITFTVNGTTLSKTVDLRITVDDNKPLRPTATIGSTEFNAASPKENAITVDSGETLTISAEPGVSIFYTTDDTCPCQNSASRNVYTGPITLDATTRYRIAAYKDGMMYSDRLNINVTVNTPVEPDPIDPGPVDPVVPDPVNPSPLENRITGINAEDAYTIGRVIIFTAIGAGMDNSSPNTGDTRWLPVSWSVNPHGDFSGGFTQTFASAEMALGAHTLHVIFAEQRYDGTTWKDTGNEDEKTVNFTLLAANTPTVDPTVDPIVTPDSSEEVANTADESMPWLWNWALMFGIAGLFVTIGMKNREKEYII